MERRARTVHRASRAVHASLPGVYTAATADTAAASRCNDVRAGWLCAPPPVDDDDDDESVAVSERGFPICAAAGHSCSTRRRLRRKRRSSTTATARTTECFVNTPHAQAHPHTRTCRR